MNTQSATAPGPDISVVIPTLGRLPLLQMALYSLSRQTLDPSRYEVIVVVDDTHDPAGVWLESWHPPHAFTWICQANAGLSAARNRGNALARAGLILSLDDDMVAHATLLEHHLAYHLAHPGHWVQGALAVHASVPRTPWVRRHQHRRDHFRRQYRTGDTLTPELLSGGHFSLARSLLEQVGGFDPGLRDPYTDTDGELALRLEARGVAFHYLPLALAWETHVKDRQAALAEAQRYGRTHGLLAERWPALRWRHSPWLTQRVSWLRRLLRHWVCRKDRTHWPFLPLERILASLAATLDPVDFLAAPLDRLARELAWWHGVHHASGGALRRFRPVGVPVLCYHQVSDQPLPPYRLYILTRESFRRQMLWLKRHNWQAVTLEQLYNWLTLAIPLPPRPLVITFDDGYAELAAFATPLLAELGFPHGHFVNSAKLGGTTDWVARAPHLPLMDAATLEALLRRYPGMVTLAAHGAHHDPMDRGSDDHITGEITQCCRDLATITGQAVDILAYPYGAHDERSVTLAARAGVRAAFTVTPGLCRPGQNLLRLPRVEIFSTDPFWEFTLKVRLGWGPWSLARRWLKRRWYKYTGLLRRLGSRGAA
ncbi:MAG: glycosyltransferase [Magnetococcus sp. WYHC-3]